MARINLLTIHWGLSYGAVLQTYASVRLLESKGHKVSVVNLIHPSRKRFYTKLRSWLLLVMDLQFSKFKKRYFTGLTSKMYSLGAEEIPDADYVVIGADQVWNRDLTTPIDLAFFVNFSDRVKKLSLASSFGKAVWDEDERYTQKIKGLLSKFEAVSVREDTGRELLHKTFGLESTLLIDPTLAYGEFDELLLSDKNRKDIYTFFVNRYSGYDECVDLISEEHQLPVFRHTKFSFYLKNSPSHWLTYIRNASVVITDSFHGVAFSIMFKKPFYVLWGESSKSTRITSLLNILGLGDRYIRSVEDYVARKNEFSHTIDYSTVDEILSVERKKFEDYICSHIE